MRTALKDTADIRMEMLSLWRQFSSKKLSVQDARVHIGFARAMLETHKVEIAAAHVELSQIPPLPIEANKQSLKAIPSRRAA